MPFWRVSAVSVWCAWHRTAYVVCVQRILSKMALRWLGGDAEETNCWIKSLFLFSLCTKYSHSFITLRLNHWWQMDFWRCLSYFSGPFWCAIWRFLIVDYKNVSRICFWRNIVVSCYNEHSVGYSSGAAVSINCTTLHTYTSVLTQR